MRYFRRFTVSTAVALIAGLCLANASAGERDKPLKVCILSGCALYKTEESLPAFQKHLEEKYNARCTWAVRQADDDLAGLEGLDDCDVALIFIKRMQLAGEQLERFKKYATSGRPIVAVRTASHAVQTWLDFDHEVLGGNYNWHHPVGPVTTIAYAEDAKKHPILTGVELTKAGDALYKNQGHAKDIRVLLTGSIPNEPAEALAWTREYKGGRIFYTSLGAPDTFEQAGFRRMLVNALFWTARRNVETRAP
ncbi:MAG TPA: ThuA domain-containing protein [Planctomycetaceae bacterium]|nr:ThuA domain-containing protein [Planctomycetaceae bacterium]